METIQSLLSEKMPDLDSVILNYVSGIVDDDGREFSNGQELYDMVGALLSDGGCLEPEVSRQLCNTLYSMVSCDGIEKPATPELHRKLDAPINIGIQAEDADNGLELSRSIYDVKKEFKTQVDRRKLDRLREKDKQKMEKKQLSDGKPKKPEVDGETMATANQMLNRRDVKADATNRSYDIHLDNIDVSYGEKVLLKDASVLLSRGRKYGLVGRNGVGKTTLLTMIAKGLLRIPSHLSVLHVEQEVVGDDTPANMSVLQANVAMQKLLAEETELSNKMASSRSTPGGALLARREIVMSGSNPEHLSP